MIGFLRKSFPTTVSSDTVKKFSLAPNNESYVINALQFIGVIDEEGKRTTRCHDILVLGNDVFPKAFEGLIRDAYGELFELRGEEAWSLGKNDLVAYFRTSDKTSEAIGARQAGLFQVFARLSGHEISQVAVVGNAAPKPKVAKAKQPAQKQSKPLQINVAEQPKFKMDDKDGRKEMALTVRIEINLPAGGSQETYDNIFKSIRANLIND